MHQGGLLASQEMNVARCAPVATSLMRTWVLVLVASSVLAISLGLSLLWQEPHWLARAGSLVAILGLILMFKRNLLCVIDGTEADLIEKLHYSPPMPEPGTALYEQEIKRARRILRDEYLGLGVSIIGTIVWGYGDLLIGLAIF